MKAQFKIGWRMALAVFLACVGGARGDEARDAALLEDLLKLSAKPPDWREVLKRPDAPREEAPRSDAEIEGLADYWLNASAGARPSRAAAERLIQWSETNPEAIKRLLLRLPEDVPELHDRLKKLEEHLKELTKADYKKYAEPMYEISEWLSQHSRYWRREFIENLRSSLAKMDGDSMEKNLRTLMRLDREAADKLLRQLADGKDPFGRTAARVWLHQIHIADTDDPRVAKWRAELRRIAEDRTAPMRERDYAIVGLMRVEWPGQEEWFLRLFRDPALGAYQQGNVVLRPLVAAVWQNPDRWIPQITPLAGGPDRIAHNNAVRCLSEFVWERARKDALEPLLPWLNDPKWADLGSDTPRSQLATSLWRVDLPASVPGLRHIIENEIGEICAGVASALAHYKATEAAAAVRSGIEKEMPMEHDRTVVMRAAVALGAYSVDEMAAAVEAYVKQLSTTQGQDDLENFDPFLGGRGVGIQVRLGGVLWSMPIDNSELAERLLQRARELAEADAKSAERLRVIVARWPAKASTEAIVERLRTGELTRAWVAQLLQRREELRAAIKEIAGLSGLKLGIQTAITGEESDLERVLGGDDRNARLALLACARHIRLALPGQKVATFLDSPDALLARVAEAYLISQDDPAARAILWRRHPGEARILGLVFGDDPSVDAEGLFGGGERMIRELTLAEGGPREVFALLRTTYQGHDNQQLLLVYPDKTVLRHMEGGGRRRERLVAPEELERFRRWIEDHRIDELPELTDGELGHVQYQYVRATRAGGRRIFIDPEVRRYFPNESDAPPDPRIYHRLVDQFAMLGKPPMQVIYDSLEGMPGFKIVHPLENGQAYYLAFEKGRLLVQTWDNDDHRWHVLTADGIGRAEAPTPVPFRAKEVVKSSEFLNAGGTPVGPCSGRLKGKYVWTAWRNADDMRALWMGAPGAKTQLFVPGNYGSPVVTPDGEWIVAAKAGGRDWASPNGVVRLRVKDRREFAVELPPADQFDPIRWLPVHGKVLLYRAKDQPDLGITPEAGPGRPEYYLLDAASGELTKVEGEFRPYHHESWRQLQPAKQAEHVWAALPLNQLDKPATVIGRYDTRRFTFHPALTVFGLSFSSLDMWVDEPARVVTFIANGDVLRLALPPQ